MKKQVANFVEFLRENSLNWYIGVFNHGWERNRRSAPPFPPAGPAELSEILGQKTAERRIRRSAAGGAGGAFELEF